jgi:hypothetical protein
VQYLDYNLKYLVKNKYLSKRSIKSLCFQNGQYFIDKLQDRLSDKFNLDDRQARMTSDRPITFEDFCLVMRELEKEDATWMEPDRFSKLIDII